MIRRKARRVQKPFPGYPHTKIGRSKKAGGWFYRVWVDDLTPLRARIADVAGWILATLLFAGGIYIASLPQPAEPGLWLAALVLPWVIRPGLQWYFRLMLRKETVITRDKFGVSVSRLLLPPKRYDGNHTNGFALREHRKADDEREKHENKIAEAQMQGRHIRPKPYLQKSRRLVLRYYHRDHELAVIYPIKRANEVIEQLQGVDIEFDSLLMNDAADFGTPEAAWGDAPGSIG